VEPNERDGETISVSNNSHKLIHLQL